MCSYYRGDLDGADRWFREASEAGAVNDRWLITASALGYRSLVAGDRGRLDMQGVFAEEAATLARERGIEELACDVHIAMGQWLAARGERDEALPFLERGVAVARSLGRPLELAGGLIRQAALLKAMGRAEAAAVVDEARATVDSCADPGVLQERLAVLDRPSRPNGRPRESGLSERELVVLRMLGGDLSERDIGRELYLSHNTIHSHTRSIYRKLGVSSRKQAIQRALQLGIL
jgi:LuxR family maltose regulon positive regulatory protein